MKRPLLFSLLIVSAFLLCLFLAGNSQAVANALPPPEKILAAKPDSLPATLQYNFRRYSLAEGLSSKETYGIFVDSRQLIWIGSYGGGAYCYNGTSFTTYTTQDGLPSDIVWDFDEDSTGRILIATDKGVVRFDGKTFTTIADSSDLGVEYCWSVLVDHNENIWIGTAGAGLFRFDADTSNGANGKAFRQFVKNKEIPSSHVWNIIEDKENNIWIALNRGGVSKITGDVITNYGDSSELLGVTVRGLTQDSRGTIWAATLKGAFCFEQDSFASYGKDGGLGNDGVTCIYEDRKGNLWFTCLRAGLAMQNQVTKEWTRYRQADGLSGIETWCVTGDKNGNIWVSTNDNGVSKYEESAFTHFVPMADASVLAALRSYDGSMWVGTDRGLIHLTKGSYFHYTTKHGLTGSYISALVEDSAHNLWIGTSTGLSMFDGKYFYNYGTKQGLAGNRVNTLTIDQNGDIWFGCNRGLHRVKNGKITAYLEPEGLSHYFIHHLRYDQDGRLWVGTFGGGVDCFDPDVIDGNPSAVIRITSKQGLSNNNIICTLRDRSGDTWVSTMADGLCIIQNAWETEPDTTKWITERITTLDGLTSNMVTSMVMDNEGNIWAGSVNGLNKISGTRGNRTIKKYLTPEGFTGIACAQNVSFNDYNNHICFGSGEFISSYDASLDIPDTIAPLLHITGVKLFFENVNWDSTEGLRYSHQESWYHLPVNLSLPHDKNHVTISFTGITHNDPEAVAYQWKLVGSEEDWNPETDKREATYSNLPAGSYTFTVRAANADGVWTENPATFSFEVRPPFWATWWFRSVAIAAIIVLLYAGIRWRFRALQTRKRELEKMVDERTAEVVQQKQEILDSINYAKHLQQALLPSEKTVAELLHDSFILYLPKDIVAGDFYWLEKKNNLVFAAAADCTGHGVPGAMVSVVCSNALNSAIKEFHLSDPGKILDKARELVVETFEKSGSDVKDGMDISLCTINGNEIHWAGANNPLWILRKDSPEIEIVQCNKQTVGKSDHNFPFTTHHLQLRKGDMLYLFTDGYADQFGGPKGKKFKYKALQQLLLSVREKSCAEQKSALETNINEWKAWPDDAGGRRNLEQVDDILVIGIRF